MAVLKPTLRAARLAKRATSMFTEAVADLEKSNELLAQAERDNRDEAQRLRLQADLRVDAAHAASGARDRNCQIIERLQPLTV